MLKIFISIFINNNCCKDMDNVILRDKTLRYTSAIYHQYDDGRQHL